MPLRCLRPLLGFVDASPSLINGGDALRENRLHVGSEPNAAQQQPHSLGAASSSGCAAPAVQKSCSSSAPVVGAAMERMMCGAHRQVPHTSTDDPIMRSYMTRLVKSVKFRGRPDICAS